MDSITNLVFKGGGVKGTAYAGALQALQDRGILKGVQRVAGASAGAITAALVACGYTAEEITTLAYSLDFTKIKDGWDPLRIPSTYGLYHGWWVQSWIENCISHKMGPDATFATLRQKGGLDLCVIVTDLTTQDAKMLSCDLTPDVIVSEAVRASMSIPLFFKVPTFTKGVPNDRVYQDGGVVWNYPITLYDNMSGSTLGLYLYDFKNSASQEVVKTGQIEDYVVALFETALNAQDVDILEDKSVMSRSIQIDDLGIKSTNFAITPAQKTALYNSGVAAANKYLNG